MKKSLLLFFYFLINLLHSQVRLTDVNFEFKKNNEYHQLISTVNPITSEIFTFASDKQSLFGAKFNSAIFFSDSLTIKKTNDFGYLIGCGFLNNNNPVSYWATKNYERFLGIEFDSNNKVTKTIEYNLNLKEEQVFAEFSDKGILYFLVGNKESKSLELITLNGNSIKRKNLDFSKCNFEDEKQNKTTFFKLLLKKVLNNQCLNFLHK